MEDNVFDINDMRRIRNMEKAVSIYEKQLSDLKKCAKLLQDHREFLFFSMTYHAIMEEQKKVAGELLKLRIRLDKVKSKPVYEFNGENNE